MQLTFVEQYICTMFNPFDHFFIQWTIRSRIPRSTTQFATHCNLHSTILKNPHIRAKASRSRMVRSKRIEKRRRHSQQIIRINPPIDPQDLHGILAKRVDHVQCRSDS